MLAPIPRRNEGDLQAPHRNHRDRARQEGGGSSPWSILIPDKAKQKGTGKWASQDAMDLGVAPPTIDAAVALRAMSGLKDERRKEPRSWPSLPEGT